MLKIPILSYKKPYPTPWMHGGWDTFERETKGGEIINALETSKNQYDSTGEHSNARNTTGYSKNQAPRADGRTAGYYSLAWGAPPEN